MAFRGLIFLSFPTDMICPRCGHFLKFSFLFGILYCPHCGYFKFVYLKF